MLQLAYCQCKILVLRIVLGLNKVEIAGRYVQICVRVSQIHQLQQRNALLEEESARLQQQMSETSL